MRLEKRLSRAGDGRTFPTAGDDVELEYTGWIYDASKADKKGKQ